MTVRLQYPADGKISPDRTVAPVEHVTAVTANGPLGYVTELNEREFRPILVTCRTCDPAELKPIEATEYCATGADMATWAVTVTVGVSDSVIASGTETPGAGTTL